MGESGCENYFKVAVENQLKAHVDSLVCPAKVAALFLGKPIITQGL